MKNKRKTNFIPDFSKEQKEAILKITQGKPTEFYLRKEYYKQSLQMQFYTKPVTTPRVSIGFPDGLKKGKYYVIDGDFRVKELSAFGRGRGFKTQVTG